MRGPEVREQHASRLEVLYTLHQPDSNAWPLARAAESEAAASPESYQYRRGNFRAHDHPPGVSVVPVSPQDIAREQPLGLGMGPEKAPVSILSTSHGDKPGFYLRVMSRHPGGGARLG